jgi:hypothetical protein
MTKTAQQQNKSTQPEPQTSSQQERDLSEAVVRVYRKFGSDLSAFRRDAEKEQKHA